MIFDQAFNQAVMAPFQQTITVSHQGIEYQIDGVFNAERDPERIGAAPFNTVGYSLEVLTSVARDLGLLINDELIVDGERYRITEPPFDFAGMTTLMLRKIGSA